MMLNSIARGIATRILRPVALLLLRWGITPSAVTLVGTIGVIFGALWFFPRGQLLTGTLFITVFVLSDSVDGIMARESNQVSVWGAFFDSTLDRMADAAVFGGLVLYYMGPGEHPLAAFVAASALVAGGLVSYVRARAEGLGLKADVGVMERADRLVFTLVPAGFVGMGVLPGQSLPVMLAVVAIASSLTVLQRMKFVYDQSAALSSELQQK